MPLRDHAELLIDEGRSWVGFHGMWAMHVLTKLNGERLSQDYRASFDVHKPQFALPTFEAAPDHVVPNVQSDCAFPPFPALTASIDFDEPRSTDVTVEYCQQLVAVVLFAHHGFTGTPHGRRAFTVKSARWLQRGTAVVAGTPIRSPTFTAIWWNCCGCPPRSRGGHRPALPPPRTASAR